jgi:hypothetical protein
MNATHSDELVSDYLSRLRSALEGVPPDRREEILDEISRHIAEERSHLASETDSDLHNLLDRIGDPEEVAAAARTEGEEVPVTIPARRIGPIEVLALVLTPFIWPVGVILLWLSPAWNVRDKLIGTLVPPGGYLFVLLAPALLLLPMTTCESSSDSTGNATQTSCSGVAALPVWQQDLISAGFIAAVVLLFVLPVVTAIYLAWRLRKWSAA